MAVYSEEEVYSMQHVASVSTEEIKNLDGPNYTAYAFGIIEHIPCNKKYTISKQSIGAIYSHHCVGRKFRKAAILCLPYILDSDKVVAA